MVRETFDKQSGVSSANASARIALGRRAEFFNSRSGGRWRNVAIGVLLALVCAGGLRAMLRGPRRERPNVLLITLDTTRADRLSCYGFKAPTTPNIDRFAKEGVRFDSAYSVVPITQPSHSTILTGTYPAYHGVKVNGTYRLEDSAVSIAEQCRDAGMATGAAMGSFVLHSQFGLSQGFEEYHDRFPQESRPASGVTDDAIAFIDRNAARPFFLWAHYFDAHFPRISPPDFEARFPGDSYEAALAYMDSQIGRLWAHLQSIGQADNTIVCIVADHGEGLGDHEPTHVNFLYEPTMRVPLILRGPGYLPNAKVVVSDVVGTPDIYPTLCEVLGFPPSKACQGSSLMGLMRGVGESKLREVFLETWGPRHVYGWSELRAVRTEQWKYIRAPKCELYDVVADPGENINLLEQRPEVAQRLATRLDALIAGLSKDNSGSKIALTKGGQGKLTRLGYFQGDAPLKPQGAVLIDPKDRIAAIYMHGKASGEEASDPLAAERDYREIIRLYPDDLQAKARLSYVLYGLGKLDEAIALADETSRAQPDSVHSTRMLAFLHYSKGEYGAALAAVDRSLKVLSSNSESHYIRSLILDALNRNGEALEAAQKALEYFPTYDLALIEKGRLLARLRRLEEAIQAFEAVDATSANRYTALDHLSKLYRALRLKSKAEPLQAEMEKLKAQGLAHGPSLRFEAGGY